MNKSFFPHPDCESIGVFKDCRMIINLISLWQITCYGRGEVIWMIRCKRLSSLLSWNVFFCPYCTLLVMDCLLSEFFARNTNSHFLLHYLSHIIGRLQNLILCLWWMIQTPSSSHTVQPGRNKKAVSHVQNGKGTGSEPLFFPFVWAACPLQRLKCAKNASAPFVVP